MKKISCLVVLLVSFLAIAIGLTSCGTSSSCKIGMAKEDVLALFDQADEKPSYDVDGKKYYWYDNTFYEVFTKYEIDLKAEENQLEAIQKYVSENEELENDLLKLHFRYRYIAFDEEDKLTEFYYDFDHRFDLSDDYACFDYKTIKNFALSKRKLEYYIEERDRMEKPYKNKTCYFIRIVDYENLSYTINFTDGTIFKGKLSDAITNDTNIITNKNSKKMQLLVYLGLDNYNNTTFNPAQFKETEILKNINYECCFKYAQEFSGVIETASYGGYIDSKNRVVEWRTKVEYLPDYVNRDEYVGEMTEKTVDGVRYRGYILNPYYEVIGVTKKDAKEIRFQEGVQVIKSGALTELTNVYELELPEGTKTIENGAIVNNPNLVGITIPISVEEIAEYNFVGCPKLLEIVSGAGIYNAEMAFKVLLKGCGYYQTMDDYKENGHTYIITTPGKDGNTYIFSKYEALENEMFDKHEDGWVLVSVLGNTARLTLPESIDAKYKNERIPITQYSIFDSAFANNDKLKEITIPDTVKNIYDNAFFGCTNLTKVTANSVKYVGNNAFSGCSSLANISFESVKELGYSSFARCTSLTAIDLPNLETSYGEAFRDCTSLEEAKLPKFSPDYINSSMFNNDTSLTSVELDAAFRIAPYMFEGCTQLTTVNAPNVENVYHNAFQECRNLEVANFSNLYQVEDRAFYNCKKLNGIVLNDMIGGRDVVGVGVDAFYGCDSLDYFEDDNCKYISSPNNKYVYLFDVIDKTNDTCIISEDVRVVNTSIFNNYPSLKHLTVPSNIEFHNLMHILELSPNLEFEKIDDYYYLGTQTNPYFMIIEADKNKENLVINEQTRFIYSEAFKDSIITDIRIPEGVDYIGESVFENTKVKELTLTDGIFGKCQYIFRNCKDLKKVTVTDISQGMFEGCTALEEVYTTTDYIWQEAFRGCTNLKKIESQSSIWYVGEEAFKDCISLETINLRRASEIWYKAFYNCTSLKTAQLTSLQHIGDYAFYNTGLTSVSLDNAQSIGMYAFANSESLATVKLGDNLEMLGSYAFSGCIKLQALDIPDAVTTLGENLFERCSTLGQVMIPEMFLEYLRTIFRNCPDMTNLYYKGTYESLEKLGFERGMLELNQHIYLYSEHEPTNNDFEYWHYNASGEIVIWK